MGGAYPLELYQGSLIPPSPLRYRSGVLPPFGSAFGGRDLFGFDSRALPPLAAVLPGTESSLGSPSACGGSGRRRRRRSRVGGAYPQELYQGSLIPPSPPIFDRRYSLHTWRERSIRLRLSSSPSACGCPPRDGVEFGLSLRLRREWAPPQAAVEGGRCLPTRAIPGESHSTLPPSLSLRGTPSIRLRLWRERSKQLRLWRERSIRLGLWRERSIRVRSET